MTKNEVPDSSLLVADLDVLATEFENEVVLLNLQDGVYYGLEDVGARIWTMLGRPVSVAAICEALVAEYDVDPARCERDVRAVVADLAERGLITVRGTR